MLLMVSGFYIIILDINKIKKNIFFTATFVFCRGAFHAPSLMVSQINDIDFNKLMTKHTNQHFDDPIELGEVKYSAVEGFFVTGLVNDLDPTQPTPGILRTFGDQEFDFLNVGELIVRNEIEIMSNKINDIPMENFVQINQPNITLMGQLVFDDIEINDLILRSTINGQNFDNWSSNAFVSRGKLVQTVSSKWTIDKLNAKDILGVGKLNNLNIEEFSKELKYKRARMTAQLAEYRSFSRYMCETLLKVSQFSQTSVYFLKYFDETFHIDFGSSNTIHSTLFFEFNENIFYLVNAGCLTIFYTWNPDNEILDRVNNFKTGRFARWESLLDGNRIKLFSSSPNSLDECPTPGLVTWIFDGKTLSLDIVIVEKPESITLNEGQGPQSVLVVNETSDVQTVIVEMDVNGTTLDEWIVPRGNLNIVPEEANVGLAFSDGKQMCRLGELTIFFFELIFLIIFFSTLNLPPSLTFF